MDNGNECPWSEVRYRHPEKLVIVIQGKAKELDWFVFEHNAHASLRSMESHVIPAKARIQLTEVDPRLRGGDEGSTLTSMGGSRAYVHSA